MLLAQLDQTGFRKARFADWSNQPNPLPREYYVFDERIPQLIEAFRVQQRLAITMQDLNLRVIENSYNFKDFSEC